MTDSHSGETSTSTTLVVSLAHHPKALPESFEEEDQLGGLPVIPFLTPAELRDEPTPFLRKELSELGLWNRLEVLDGVLYCKWQEGAQTHYQLMLPEGLRSLVLKNLHDDMGHMGTERTLDLARKRFYWPKMSAAVEVKMRTWNRCI